jgi:hypothetical protein
MSSASDTDADAEWEDDWVHKPIWWLDGALAAAYFLEVYHLVFHVFLAPGPGRREEDGPVLLATVAGLTAATAIVIHALNAASEAGGRWLSDGPLRAAPFNRPLRTRKSMRKFKAQFWQLVVHVAFAVLEWRVLHDEPSWFEQPWRCFVPAPHHQTNKPEVHQLYLTQIGVWLYMGVCQCCFLDKQKDYYQLMSHHIITLAGRHVVPLQLRARRCRNPLHLRRVRHFHGPDEARELPPARGQAGLLHHRVLLGEHLDLLALLPPLPAAKFCVERHFRLAVVVQPLRALRPRQSLRAFLPA